MTATVTRLADDLERRRDHLQAEHATLLAHGEDLRRQLQSQDEARQRAVAASRWNEAAGFAAHLDHLRGELDRLGPTLASIEADLDTLSQAERQRDAEQAHDAARIALIEANAARDDALPQFVNGVTALLDCLAELVARQRTAEHAHAVEEAAARQAGRTPPSAPFTSPGKPILPRLHNGGEFQRAIKNTLLPQLEALGELRDRLDARGEVTR